MIENSDWHKNQVDITAKRGTGRDEGNPVGPGQNVNDGRVRLRQNQVGQAGYEK
jgi:hypothetical protein